MSLARFSMVFLGMALVGCAVQPSEPQTSQAESDVTYVKLTEHWDVAKNDINDVWPATTGNGTPITNMYVLMKGAPVDAYGNPQFFGFVIWNTNTLGHIYRVKQGADGGNFRNIWNSAIATRTNGAPDHSAGGAGNVDADPPIPRPYPTGDGEYWISSAEIANAKTTAGSINAAIQGFQTYVE